VKIIKGEEIKNNVNDVVKVGFVKYSLVVVVSSRSMYVLMNFPFTGNSSLKHCLLAGTVC